MRIGTRGSALALAQAGAVAQLLPGAELVVIQTSGDQESADASGSLVPDKSRWVDAIEQALLTGQIDLAVHSAKDLPGQLPDGLALLGTLARAPAEDVICGASSLAALRPAAKVGTSSLRRRSQLLAARADLDVLPLAGNVDTRLKRLHTGGELDAIVLAHAGLLRLCLAEGAGATSLEPERFVPSPGQGALALQARDGDDSVASVVAEIVDADAFACLRAERALALALDAGCHTPLGAHAQKLGGELALRAWVGLPDGSAWICDATPALSGEAPDALGERLAQRMLSAGAARMLAEAEAYAA